MEDVLDAGLFGFSKKGMAFYQDFHRLEDVEAFAVLLREADIPYAFEEVKQVADPTWSGSSLLPGFVLNAFPRDFERINALVTEQVAKLDEASLDEHFLAGYSAEELLTFLRDTKEKGANQIVAYSSPAT